MSKERTRSWSSMTRKSYVNSLSGWLAKDGYTLDVAPDGPTALEKIGWSGGRCCWST